MLCNLDALFPGDSMKNRVLKKSDGNLTHFPYNCFEFFGMYCAKR